jgi:hypothetical protein
MTRIFLLTLAALQAAAAAPDAAFVPLLFVPNRGQARADIGFMAKGRLLNVYFREREVMYKFAGASLRLEFLDTYGPRRLEAAGKASGEANFLIGAEETWRRGVPLVAGVAYRDLYPGIDLIYLSRGADLKSEFVVAPGADPAQIRMQPAGADQVRVEADGSLSIVVGSRVLRETAPVVYQECNGQREPIQGAFDVNGDVVSFAVGAYDRSLPLTIDPVVYYLTLLGGSSTDAALSLAVDSSGAAYIAGFTSSNDLPVTSAEQSSNAGDNDILVAKLSAAGNSLVYCTYIGGRGDDRANGIVVDSSGAAYVTGWTNSSDFPVRNALQPRLAGGQNAFVLKLAPAGNALVFSTYLGGGGSDSAYGIALDSVGNAYITGDTTSSNFPVTDAAFQRSLRSAPDAFVMKIAADGSQLLYSTYLGGSREDHATAIAVDGTGSAFVTGSTYSFDFPVSGAFQSTIGGGQDAFVVRLAADGQSLLFSTYLGGSGGTVGWPEEGRGITLDGQGNVYVAGVTSSNNFPVLNAAQSALAGWLDAFAAKFSAAGSLIYSTYLGGFNIDIGNAIAVDTAGKAYIAGETNSPGLASLTGTTATPTGIYDAFAIELAPGGNAVTALVYLGGTGSTNATAIVVDTSANIYLAGYTQAPDFPTVNAIQTINGGDYSAFVGRLPSASVSISPEFGDVPLDASYFEAANLMFQAGVTTGCVQSSDPSTRQFCPNNNVTREEMAAFIVRAVTGNVTPTIYNPTPYFQDVPPSNPFFAHIQKLMDLGITTGCSTSPALYCPADTIPRWQMAIFMVRARLALYGASFTTATTPYFTDVPVNVEGSGMPFPFIQRAYEEHITSGCGGTDYCPDQLVTRGQMASLIVRGLFNETMVVAANAPQLTSASPNTVSQTVGSQITVTITGSNTNFQSGDPVTVPSGMLSVSNVAVNSATSITATLTVNSNAQAGPQSLVVTTGAQNITLPLAIKVGTY